MPTPFVAIVVLGFVGAVPVACGGDSEEEKRQAAAEKQEQRERAERRKEQARFEDCEETFADLQDALTELGSRLDVGLSYDEYTNEVGDVKVAYDQTDFDSLEDFDCLGGVGLPLERALNQYSKAAGVWSDCFDDIDCDVDSIDPQLQSHWARATKAVESSKSGLDDLQP